MKTKTMAVAVLGLALLGTPAVAAPHNTQDHSAHHAIRYASVKACTAADGARKPCGYWRLALHDGSVQLLKDAQVVALTAKGTSSVYQAAPISVSGDGSKVAYFDRRGRLAIRTLGGGVTVLPKNALPPVAQYNITLVLSDDGRRLAAMQSGGDRRPVRVFDTATGARVGTIPAAENFADFSGDGDEVLTTSDGDEGTFDLGAYSDTGALIDRATPPQLVSANGPHALAADGRTVANVVAAGKPELVLYDMRAEKITSRVKVKLPAGSVHMIDWTGPSQVTLHLEEYRDTRPTRMTIVQIDVVSGAVKIRDRYEVLADSYVFAACGG
ncbi:hypothetical protein [Nonomuraea soli]|uniref:WD40 repeat domain-containing protein n=1 Tax=Nonomuraea soli TaxID=1032476 RepID=A0A7W0CPJ9_9ACTN|nr:hypothetical protein [Nonomuraea soli]MBA2895011.1 hypothetical protein [Nonomuraea soli]